MTTTQSTTPAALVSTSARLAAALVVVVAVSAAWLAAGHESRDAVRSSTAAMNTIYVTLPTVEIVGKREAAGPTAVAGRPAARNTL